MRRKRTRHPNDFPAVYVGVCALLFVCALGLLLHRCSVPSPPQVQPQGNVVELEDNVALTLQLQDPQLPNGCEVTSLAMLLGWAGYPVDKVENGYLTANPLEGWKWVQKTQFWAVFDAMGRRAVTVTE